jgi:hypothetical protein
MSTIPTRLLNKTATQTRRTFVVGDSGASGVSETTISSSLIIRVTLNDRMIDHGRTGEGGQLVVVSHVGFVLPSASVLKGDFVTVDGIKYRVQYVEDNPGGLTDHHKELYLEAVE